MSKIQPHEVPYHEATEEELKNYHPDRMRDGVNYPGYGVRNHTTTHVLVASVPKTDRCPSGTIFLTPSGETTMQHIIDNDLPKDTISWEIMTPDMIPQDPTFRDAIVLKDGALEYDMPQAIALHQNMIRRLRDPLLEKLDIEYTRAIETNNVIKANEIVAQKNVLRNSPLHPDILKAKTIEELKRAIPSILKTKEA